MTNHCGFRRQGYLAKRARAWALLIVLADATSCPASSQPAPNATASFPSWQILSGDHFENWKGIESSAEEHAASLSAPSEAIFRYPDGPNGAVRHGYRTTNDSTADWHNALGLQLEIKLADDQPAEVTASIGTPTDTDESDMVKGVVTVQGSGWHTVTLPWSAFAFDHANTWFLQTVKEIRFSVKSAKPVLLRNVRVIDGDPLALTCDIQGKSAPAPGSVEYAVTVRNCALTPQSVSLSFVKHGWEAMAFSVDPAMFSLNPGESKACTVHVDVPGQVAPGGHEEQVLQAIGNGRGDKAATMTFVTARALPHPYILHTPEAWQEIRDKVKKYPWAKAAQDKYLAEADAWSVPEIAQPPGNDPHDNYGPFLFATTNEHGLMASAISWQLTGDKKYADKVALFLRRLSDPQEGYPKTFRASNQAFVQEGHFFQHIAMSYDLILDSGVLTAGDQKQINATLRLAMETFALGNMGGAINNWNLSELCGAFYCALVLQDLSQADYFFSCPSGIKSQLAKGVMDDGWWNECAISYNTWCTSEFSQVAIAYAPWGVNFRDMWVPASFYQDSALSGHSGKAVLNGGDTSGDSASRLNINQLQHPFGMTKEIWGPHTKSYREIRQMWNSLPPFIDYRGVMFGVNDSTERRPADQDEAYDIAYYLYHDPVYASVVKLEKSPSLLYGDPELPAQTPNVSGLSAYADNAGVAMLRSQTPDRPQREQIQAVLHYGTHGWAHGHYDRTDLISLMRYGRSFYNPEMIWYGYEPFMYKFYVQTSVNHNMVVVDQKMQEPVESHRLLFYTGKLLQATAVETDARWSNPPYGGMVYDYVPVKTFAEKCWREGRDVPIPDRAPAYGTLTDYTEPVLQRRLLVVTDDYVVVADYLQAKEKHTFDNVLQLTGFDGLDAPGKNLLRHDAQWNPDPVGSAQFVTDCDWYSAQAPAVGHFSMHWKADADPKKAIAPTAFSEDGVLKMDVHSLWPQTQQIMVGQSPQVQGNEKKLWYTVKGDGKVLADGKFGSWILGQANVDVPVQGIKTLDLETKTEGAKKNTLFWGNARVVTADGKEIPLAQLPVKYDNIVQPLVPGKDYYGQPVKIVGVSYDQATPAEPQDATASGVAHVDLSGVNAVRFKAVLGGAFPLADGTQLHKVYAIRSVGTEARFLTLIEPFENHAVVKSAQATGPDTMHVELSDGRVQDLTLHNLEGDGKDISVEIHETRDGREIADENTAPAHP